MLAWMRQQLVRYLGSYTLDGRVPCFMGVMTAQSAAKWRKSDESLLDRSLLIISAINLQAGSHRLNANAVYDVVSDADQDDSVASLGYAVFLRLDHEGIVLVFLEWIRSIEKSLCSQEVDAIALKG